MERQRTSVPSQTYGDTLPLEKIKNRHPSDDFWWIHKLWVGQTHRSDSVKCKAGVLILIHKNLPCEVVSSAGRLLTLHLCISNKNLIVTNIYVPDSPTKSFFQAATAHLTPYLQYPLLLGGDFNTVMDMQEDKCRGKVTSQPHLNPPKSH